MYPRKDAFLPLEMNPIQSPRNKYSPLHSSGIETVDAAWGGLFRGGAYLYYGEAAAGRNLLTLLFSYAGHSSGEQTIFISSDRYSELKIQAGSLGFDLASVLDAGNLHLVRIPPRMKLRDMGDDGVAQALQTLTAPFTSLGPKRLVINDFMPFVAFRSFERFRVEFVRFLERADALDATLVLAISEPANDHSARVIEFMISHLTGAIHLERHVDQPTSTKRRLSLIPTSGHIKGYTFEHWDLEDIVTQSAETPMYTTIDPARRWQSKTEPPAGTPGFATPDISQPESDSSVSVEPAISDFDQTPSFAPPRTTDAPGYSHTRLFTPVVADPVIADPTILPVGSGLDIDISDTNAFLKRLDRAERVAAEIGDDFVLVAFRLVAMGDARERAIGFEFLLDVVHDVLKPHDDMVVDMDEERLVVFLAHAREEESVKFFATIKDQLIRESPQKGSGLLSRISAIVGENAEPFDSASEFVSFALSADMS